MLEGTNIGGFRVGELLGEGAVAVVHRAEPAAPAHGTADGDLGPIALKVLKPEAVAMSNVVASFEYEARVLSRLDHPGIPRVHASGVDGDQIYVAMELVEGPTVERLLIKRLRLDQGEAVPLARQLAAALDHLHEVGYVHRDVKPANLVLTDEGRLYLMDFGTAVRAGTRLDYELGLYGTVAYLAPEQIVPGGRIDGRADLYALGGLLYRMVTGQRPFEGTREDVLEAHVHAELPPVPRRVRMSEELETLIRQAMAKDPQQRPRSGAEMVAELDRIDELGEPPPTGLVERWRARRKAGAGAGR